MPAWLKGDAADNWRQIVADLPKTKLKSFDAGVLAAYCVALAQFAECQRGLDADGLLLVVRDDKGTVKHAGPSPWALLQKTAAAQIKALGAELGLSPRSRRVIEAAPRAAATAPAAAEAVPDLENLLSMSSFKGVRQ